ncbi:MAG: outer membrane protein assembly factor BamE [Granulosicoccaceae bacterium]
MNPKILLILLGLSSALAGCANGFLPKAHRHAMQQGNMIERSDIERLQLGMNSEQVRYLLGNPVIANLASDNEWLYSFSAGKLVEPGEPQLLLVEFKNGLVVDINDDYNNTESLTEYHRNVESDFD